MCIGIIHFKDSELPENLQGWFGWYYGEDVRGLDDVFIHQHNLSNNPLKPGINGPFINKESAITSITFSKDLKS